MLPKLLHILPPILFFLSVDALSQIEQIDSAKFYHNKLVEFQYENLDSMLFFLGKHRESIEESDTSQLSMYYSMLGVYFQKMTKYDSSTFYQKMSLLLATAIGDSLNMARSNQRLGVTYKFQGLYDEAIAYFTKSRLLADAIQDFQISGSASFAITQSYSFLKQYEKAKKEIIPTIEKARELNDNGILYASLIELGNVHLMTGALDSSLDNYLEATQIMETIGKREGSAAILGNIGAVYFFKNNFSKAIDYYSQSIILSHYFNDRVSASIGTMNLSEAYYSIGKYQLAEDSLLSTLRVNKEINAKNLIVENYNYLYQLELKRERYKDAIGFLELKHMYQDSVMGENTMNKINELEVQYQTIQKEQRLVEKELEVQTKEATIVNQRNTLMTIILGSALAALTAIFLFHRNRAKQKQKLQLAVLEEKERGFNNVITAAENERNRISKDLHDGIGQQLSALKLSLSAISKEITNVTHQKALVEVVEKFSRSADEVRQISHQMMPRTLAELGLLPALEDLLANSFGQTTTEYSLEQNGLDQDRLHQQIEVSIYRIIQELINNIIKHAGATQVFVQLLKRQDKLIVFVEDNGKGFIFGDNASGHGIMNIRSRIDMIKGSVNFEPSPGSGTSVSLTIPLKND